jgi:hypothetical protein
MKNVSIVILVALFLTGTLLAQNKQYLPGDNFPLFNVTFSYTGCSTIFDATSNATPQNIIQECNNPNRIHIACMYAPPGDGIAFPNRKTRYYTSTDRGQSWSFIVTVPDIRSGYPAITLTSDNKALIANHSNADGLGNRTYFYIDILSGLGSFTQLHSPDSIKLLWPRVLTTNSISLTNKFIGIGIPGGTSGMTNILVGQSLSAPGTFSPTQFYYFSNPECYTIARGSDGRIGIVYHNGDSINPVDYGSVFFIESTDNGTTFSSPLKIFKADMLHTGDSLGAFRGIQIVYQENVPKVVFEVVKQNEFGSFFQNSGKNCIRFWSSNLPGNDPYRSIIIADTSIIGYHPIINIAPPTNNDAFTNICRPTIGASVDGTGLFVAFNVPSSNKGGSIDTVSFMDVWLTYSVNNGLNWITPSKITPVSPIKDWTYPSISPSNDNTSSNYYVNMLMLSDSIPGSYIAHTQNGESNAKYMFARVEIPRTLPSAPILMLPENGSTSQPKNPILKWNPVPNATSYQVQISLDSTFTTILFDSANITSTSIQIPQNILNINTKYFWRVNASNASGSGPWSAIWNFTVDTVPFYSISGTVRYKDNNQPVSTGYVKIMKLNTTNLNIITFDSVLIQTNGVYTFPSIRKDADYYISPYPNSTTQNDNFVPTYYPSEILWERATPVSVNTNLTNIDINVYRAFDSVGYNTIIGNISIINSPSSVLKDVIVYAKKDANFHRFSISNLYGQYTLNNLLSANYKLYFSRLGYRSDSISISLLNGQSTNSIDFQMIPYISGITNNVNIIPLSFNLYQNYPNPFNPVTKIKFDIPKTSNVVLKIFDITGREITKLFNSKLQAGRYELTWDASRYASGLYFVRIETNSYVNTKKMILIK